MGTLRPFGLISTTLWQSAKFTRLTAMDSRLAYIWLHTSQKTCAGVLRVGPAHLLEEVDFVDTLDRASGIFTELQEAGLIDWQRPYVVLGNFLAFNPVKTFRHAIGAFNETLAMPDGETKTRLMNEIRRTPGAMDLANWRDKNGNPHEVILKIHEHFSDELNPSETPDEGLGNPPGIKRMKKKKEKGEYRTPVSAEAPTVPAEMSQHLLRKEQGPREATKLSPLAQYIP